MTEPIRPALRLPLAALAGAGAALGQVPVSLVPVALAALGVAGWLCRHAPGPGGAAWTGFAAGVGYFALTLHWIVEPFLVDVQTHGWMAPFALVFISTGFALFWAGAFALARWIGGAGGWRFALAFGGALAAVEMARSLILTGFPWALLGYVWTEGPGAQIAAWTGPFGLTLATTLLAGGLAALGPRAMTVPALAAAWLLPLGFGALRAPAPPPAPDAPLMRIVQPDIPQADKWRAETAQSHVDRLLDLTASGPPAAVTIWPETTVPYLLEPGHPALAPIADAARGGRVVLGAQRVDEAGYYNSLLVVGPDGRIQDIYDKHHLVPFGEYIPLGNLAGALGIRGLAQAEGFGYTPGPGPRLVDLGPAGAALPLICYEAIFPEEVANAPDRPRVLLQITNDGWFGTFAGPQQHLAQARMRAIEQGLPLLRSANTGISAAIDAGGEILDTLPLNTAGRIDTPLPAARAPTLYARTGDWPAALAIALALALPRLRRPRG